MTNNTYNTKIDSMLARECALREAGLEKASCGITSGKGWYG